MADDSKVVGYCAYSGQALKGKQLKQENFHTMPDGTVHRLVRWAGRRYNWAGDALIHRVTRKPVHIHPNAVADAAIELEIAEHDDPNEPKKARKSKKTAQPASQDVSPAKDDVPITQPAEEPEDEEDDAEAVVQPESEAWDDPVVAGDVEDEVVD
jgi:hypothetical protein